jgi:hypothetical protein
MEDGEYRGERHLPMLADIWINDVEIALLSAVNLHILDYPFSI